MADEEKKADDPAAQSSVPEVEAEIVEEGGDQSDAAAFSNSGGLREDIDGPSASGARRFRLTPGAVLLLALALVLAGALGYWRMQVGGRSAVIPDNEMSPAGAAAPTPVETSDETPAAAAPTDASRAPGASANAPVIEPSGEPSKIDNSVAAAAEAAKSDGAPATLEDPGLDETFLPPLPGKDVAAADDVLRRTKDAADLRKTGPAIALENTETDGAPGPQPSGDVDLGAPVEAAAGADKIANELSALKEAFRAQTQLLETAREDDRSRSAALREEILALRREFADALAARDEQANAEISSLRADLEKIRNEGGIVGSRRAAAVVALGALQTAAAQGRPYAAEFDALQRLAPDAPALSALRRYADDGAPTVAALEDEFSAAAREGLAAAARGRAGGFFARLIARAQSLVSVRPAAPQSGTSPRAVISRAEAAVGRGDVAGALREIDALPQAAQAAMGAWTDKARAREAVDQALISLAASLKTPAGD